MSTGRSSRLKIYYRRRDAHAIAVADPDAWWTYWSGSGSGNPGCLLDGGANSDRISTALFFDYARNGQLTGEWTVEYINRNWAARRR